MSSEDKPKSDLVGNQKQPQVPKNRASRTSHQPSTHKGIHRGTSPHKGPLVAAILEALDDKRKQALELHHSTDESSERSLAAGCYAVALEDASGIVKHCAERLSSKASL